MDSSTAVIIDVDIATSFEYAFKAPYEYAMASEYDYQCSYYIQVFNAPQIACEELTEDYTVSIVYVNGIPWFITHEEETIILIFDEHNVLLKEYSSLYGSAIIRIEIFNQ